jgi:hypothetical protein
MHTQADGFRAETVDEQIEQLALARRHQQATSEVSVVQDLHDLYEQGDTPEQVRRSLDTIWSRLADHLSPEAQTMFSAPEVGTSSVNQPGAHPAFPLLSQSSEQMEEVHTVGRPMALPPHERRRSSRRTLLFSVMAAVVLLGLFSWVMVAQLTPNHTSKLGSGSGTPTPTVPATPAPQSLQDQAQQLVNQFHQEVMTWGNTHQYEDPYDGKNYTLDYAYGQKGSGGVLDGMLGQAKSSADYQSVIDSTQIELTNLHAMEANYSDSTPWNQTHHADTDLMSQYKLNLGTVIVVSLLEQSMRVYQNGHLVKAFQVTTGGYDTPALPGSWQVLLHQTNVTLKSSVPKGSPDWYPPTPVQYALLFHSGGYLICDSWWRASYGPGTEFPGHNSSGTTAVAPVSVNLATPNMAWLYKNTQVNTPVVIY